MRIVGHQSFDELLRAAFSSHVLMQAYEYVPAIIRYEIGELIDPEFCEVISGAGKVIAMVVWPGFSLDNGDAIIKCKVAACD